jgi:hypothetical protein
MWSFEFVSFLRGVFRTHSDTRLELRKPLTFVFELHANKRRAGNAEKNLV